MEFLILAIDTVYYNFYRMQSCDCQADYYYTQQRTEVYNYFILKVCCKHFRLWLHMHACTGRILKPLHAWETLQGFIWVLGGRLCANLLMCVQPIFELHSQMHKNT